jgi:hypothetical protein
VKRRRILQDSSKVEEEKISAGNLRTFRNSKNADAFFSSSWSDDLSEKRGKVTGAG